MKRIQAAVIAVFLSSPFYHGSVRAGSGDISPEESERIVQNIYATAIPIYKRCRGVESLRTEIVNEYDPETNKLRRTTEAAMRRKDFYYTEPEIEVLACKIDGKEASVSNYRVMKSLPAYPVFDGKGKENYTLKVIGKKNINGRECYQVQVEPKMETPRHFRGSMFFSTDKLDSVMVEGTMAKLSFPIKEFGIKLYTKHLNDVPVVISGEVRVRVKVAVFYPDTMIVTTIAVKDNKLIQ